MDQQRRHGPSPGRGAGRGHLLDQFVVPARPAHGVRRRQAIGHRPRGRRAFAGVLYRAAQCLREALTHQGRRRVERRRRSPPKETSDASNPKRPCRSGCGGDPGRGCAAIGACRHPHRLYWRAVRTAGGAGPGPVRRADAGHRAVGRQPGRAEGGGDPRGRSAKA
ncbi:hypothetical protein G6F46_013831 [Rhizopus delemar]|nr:hypothetical protein G6F46_013831 [Rhizopus delemar]